jgi:hypothetical protein
MKDIRQVSRSRKTGRDAVALVSMYLVGFDIDMMIVSTLLIQVQLLGIGIVQGLEQHSGTICLAWATIQLNARCSRSLIRQKDILLPITCKK